MNDQFSLEINNPCLENFNQFAPTDNGGFCDNCNKEVIDFSKMNSKEVMDFFKNKSNQAKCGKFTTNQFKSFSEKPLQRKTYNLLSGIGLACLSLFSFSTTQAQSKESTQKPSESKNQNQEKDIKVKGTVSNENYPLPGVSVVLKGTSIGAQTDFEGNFEFPTPLKNGDVLVFSFIGMESQKVVIKISNSVSKVSLKIDMVLSSCVLMGEVSVKKVYSSKKS